MIAAAPSHRLHDAGRAWRESNCAVDLWIELLHQRDLEPTAALGSAVRLDFEGDHVTFWKLPPADLELLYGVEVVELPVWRPVLEHVREQLARDRVVIPEVDAWWLPDTQGVTYREAHAKTSIAIRALDVRARRLEYIHNAGTWVLGGDDFDGLFAPHTLPPYTEVAKFERSVRRPDEELGMIALGLLRHHVAYRPGRSPIAELGTWLHDMLPALHARPAGFHDFAFTSLRQLGAAFELLGSHLQWLEARAPVSVGAAIGACNEIAEASKGLQFALARLVLNNRPADLAPFLQRLDGAWRLVMRTLDPLAHG